MRLIWFVILFHVCVAMVAATQTPTPIPTAAAALAAPKATASPRENNFREFIEQAEQLVLNTTEDALKVTTHIYRNLTNSVSGPLQNVIVPITTEYIRMVEETFNSSRNYSVQRKLFRHFRHNNMKIERLRQQLQPQHSKIEFHLISPEFYYGGKNVTEFDNLYLKFMVAFQHLAQLLYQTMSAAVVEKNRELFDILDEISKEKELSEKDKLYDEFIEMFLFKAEVGPVENRQLD